MESIEGRKLGMVLTLSLLSIPFKMKLLQPSHDPATLKPPRYPNPEPWTGGRTPAVNVGRDQNIRPASGVSDTTLLSITAPSCADSAFTDSVLAVTVMSSETALTSRTKSS